MDVVNWLLDDCCVDVRLLEVTEEGPFKTDDATDITESSGLRTEALKGDWTKLELVAKL